MATSISMDTYDVSLYGNTCSLNSMVYADHCPTIHCGLSMSTDAESRSHFKTQMLEESTSLLMNQRLGSSKDVNTVEQFPLACSLCKKIFDGKETLLYHERSHEVLNGNLREGHVCPNCEKRFPSISLLKSHVNLFHSNPSDSRTHEGHLLEKANDKKRGFKWICETCGKAFRSSRGLQEHTVVHTGARDFPCRICGKAFGTAANMRIHLTTHSDQRPFTCQTCGATFRQKDSLKVHVRKHTGERPFTCSVCKQAFDRGFILKNHMLTHGEKSFVCSMCGKAFSTKGGLNNHERLHLKDPNKPKKERGPRSQSGTGNWICDECGKIYSSRHNLKVHKKSHEPSQTFHVCPVCSQSYKSRDSLKVHMRRHTEDRRFKCSMCPRSFYRNYTLKIHILTHTGEKPHQCPKEGCNKSFAQNSSLAYHVGNHKKQEEGVPNSSGKRPYKKRKAFQVNSSSEMNMPSSLAVTDNISTLNDVKSSTICNVKTEKPSASTMIQEGILGSVDPTMHSILEDMPSSIDHGLPSVWNGCESSEILGVVPGYSSAALPSGSDHSMVIDLHQHSQPFISYVPSEELPLIVSVSGSTNPIGLYHQDGAH